MAHDKDWWKARCLAVARLHLLGVDIRRGASHESVLRAVEGFMRRVPCESEASFMFRFGRLEMPCLPGEATRRQEFAFRELKPIRHLRADEIEALPEPIGMCSNAQPSFMDWRGH